MRRRLYSRSKDHRPKKDAAAVRQMLAEKNAGRVRSGASSSGNRKKDSVSVGGEGSLSGKVRLFTFSLAFHR